MFLRSFKFLVAALTALLVLAGCGGDAAPAPTGLKVTSTESTVTLTWDMVPGVEYWVFDGPTIYAPTTGDNMQKWIGLPGGGVFIKVTSPHVITALTNGLSYSFTVNGRTNSGPGGPGAAPVTITPQLAGTTWTAGAANSAGTTDLRAVTFGALYVAAGNGGTMFSSADAASWTPINFTSTATLNGGAFFTTYKLVGDAGTVITSADAITWARQTTPTTENLYAIASNNSNLNVAVGAKGTIITSVDGVTWTPATTTATTKDLYGVNYSTFNGGTWIAVGAAGTIVKSTDGLTWTAVASNTTADLRGVAYGVTSFTTGTTIYVVAGAAGTVLSSVDSITWATSVLPGAATINAVVQGGQFVLAGAAGTMFIGTDGVTWTQISPKPTTQDIYAVARGSFAYSAVGVGGSNLAAR